MKTKLTWAILLIFCALALGPAPFALASEPLDPVPDMWTKAGRGLCNIAFGWAEIVYQPARMAEQGERWPIAIAGGAVLGVFKGIERTLLGVYETLTFPVPNPCGDYAPIIEPDFVIPPG